MNRHPLLTTLKEFNRECDKYYYKIYSKEFNYKIYLEKINYKYIVGMFIGFVLGMGWLDEIE